MSDDAAVPEFRPRRWRRIVALLFFLTLVSGGIYWFARPATASATALFKVRIKQDSLLSEPDPNWQVRFDILKKTQLALLKSRFLRTAAVRMPGVSSLSIYA